VAVNWLTSWQECAILDRTSLLTEVGELVDGAPFNGIGGVPADDGPYDFFVSYVPADQAWASWIAWQIEKRLRLEGRRSPKLFFRDWDVVPGMHETFRRHLALTASARLVAVLTPDYLASPRYNIEEWSTFWSDDPGGFQRRVVPVRVKACQPDGLLQSVRPIDLVGQDDASATDTLMSGINASLDGRAKPVIPPEFLGLGRQTEETVAGPSFPGPPVLVGEPPAVPPKWFQDRDVEVEDIEARNRYRANEHDFQSLDAYGLVACGLALLGEPSCLVTALKHYRTARKITTGPGAVKRTLMLLKQFEPRADPRILEQVRAAAKGERSGRALQED